MNNIVVIEATGSGVKRYINICHHHNICIKNIQFIDDMFSFEMKAKDYMKSKAFIKITGIKTRIINKKGIYFRLNKNRNRYGLVFGLMIFIGGLLFLSRFIWDIRINGNLYYSDETIIEYLYSKNIKKGVVAILDEDGLEADIRANFDRIIWVSVSVNGTGLIIDLKENNTNPNMSVLDGARDIIASKDGVIESVMVRTGTPIVKPGDTVQKGDVLVTSKVSCINEYGEEIKQVYTNADADIMINTSYSYEDIINRDYSEKEYTGNVIKENLIRIGNRELSTNFKCKYKNYDVVTEYSTKSISLVTYGYRYYREYNIINKSYSDESLRILLEDNFNEYLNILQENSIQITGKSVKIDLYGHFGSATGNISVIEPAIAYSEPIITKQVEGF